MMFKYLRIFKDLLVTDFIIMKGNIRASIINTIIWTAAVTVVSTYVLPAIGINKSYGAMMLIASIATCGVFQIFGNAAFFVGDIDGDKTISYQLTLPLPGWLLWTQKALYFAVHSAIISLFILPLGKLLIGNQLVLSGINPLKFIAAFCFTHLLFGCFTLVMIAYTPNMSKIEHVWTRLLFPLWFFGGSQYNWYTLNTINPSLSYVTLANPFVYAFEAIKSASLDGQYLPFWVSISVIIIFCAIFIFIGHKKLQHRLDYL